MKKILLPVLYISLAFLLGGCEDDFQPEDAYLKIYDDQLANRKYYPMDIEQTSDGGYIILSAVDQWDIHVMKIDNEGEYVGSYTSAGPYVSPVPKLLNVNGALYFFCMDHVGLFTYLMQVSNDGNSISPVQTYPDILYPLAATAEGGTILLQNYDRDIQMSGFQRLGADFSVASSAHFNIFENVETLVVDHITHAGRRLPFFCGMTEGGGTYFMNGFYNYSFSLVFASGEMNFTGVYNGSNYNGAVSSALHLEGETYAVSRFAFGNNYINPSAAVSPGTVGFAENIGGTGYSELQEDAYVVAQKITIGNKNLTAMLSNTISNKMVLFLFDRSTGALVGKKYIGNNVPYEVADFAITEDGGMIVLAQVYIAGSYPRICVNKISKEEVMEMAGVEE